MGGCLDHAEAPDVERGALKYERGLASRRKLFITAAAAESKPRLFQLLHDILAVAPTPWKALPSEAEWIAAKSKALRQRQSPVVIAICCDGERAALRLKLPGGMDPGSPEKSHIFSFEAAISFMSRIAVCQSGAADA